MRFLAANKLIPRAVGSELTRRRSLAEIQNREATGMSSPSFCTHSTTNPRNKTSIKLLLTFCKALYSSNTSESTDFPAQATIQAGAHPCSRQHWSCHITHRVPGDYGSIPIQYRDEKAGNDGAGAWRGAAGAGKKLSGPGAVCDLQGEPQDLQSCPKPAPGSGSLLQGAGPCKGTWDYFPTKFCITDLGTMQGIPQKSIQTLVCH